MVPEAYVFERPTNKMQLSGPSLEWGYTAILRMTHSLPLTSAVRRRRVMKHTCNTTQTLPFLCVCCLEMKAYPQQHQSPRPESRQRQPMRGKLSLARLNQSEERGSEKRNESEALSHTFQCDFSHQVTLVRPTMCPQSASSHTPLLDFH